MRKLKKPLAAAALLAVLSGCWHVPMSALWRLRALDALSLDPAAIRLAVLAPQWIEAPPGHVHVLAVSHAGEPDEVELKLDLVESREPRDLAALNAEPLRGFARPDAHFALFRLSDADVARVEALQRRARAEKAAGGAGHRGRIQLTAEPCRRDAPPGPAWVDLFLRVKPNEDFFQIYENVDLRDPSFWAEKRFEDAVPPCAAPATKASGQRRVG